MKTRLMYSLARDFYRFKRYLKENSDKWYVYRIKIIIVLFFRFCDSLIALAKFFIFDPLKVLNKHYNTVYKFIDSYLSVRVFTKSE